MGNNPGANDDVEAPLTHEEMDRSDIEAAEKSLAEPGENITLEQLIQELGD